VKTNVTLRLEMAVTEYAAAAGALRKVEKEQEIAYGQLDNPLSAIVKRSSGWRGFRQNG
jgi:hypothetical protein